MLYAIIYRKKRMRLLTIKNTENSAERGKATDDLTFGNPIYEMKEIGDNGQVKGFENAAYQMEEPPKDSCL